MADQSHLDILRQGVEAWNSWREANFSIWEPNLSGADLSGAKLSGAVLTGANLSGANLADANLSGAKLSGAKLYEANLSSANLSSANLHNTILAGANLTRAHLSHGAILFKAKLPRANLTSAYLSRANLYEANLSEAILPGANLADADLSGAKLSGADLSRAHLAGVKFPFADLSGANLSSAYLYGANLTSANLTSANLSDATLMQSTLVETNLTGTTLTGCRIYGISAWNLKLEGTIQHSLNVSDFVEPDVMVDNLEVAQFVYLLLNNEKIRQVIDTITSKVVLILGRFTADRKAVLEAIRDELRQRDYLPILFDFEKPAGRDLTETISTLAHLARFIIADITQAKSIPQELQAIVPNLPSVPVQPLLLTSEREYGMFEHFRRYPWVLDTYYYDNLDDVLASVEDKVISPAETKARELSS